MTDFITKVKNSVPTIVSDVEQYIIEFMQNPDYGLAHSSVLSIEFVSLLCEYFVANEGVILLEDETVASKQPLHVLHEVVDIVEFWGLLYYNGLIIVRQVNGATPSINLMLFATKDIFEKVGLVVKDMADVLDG